MTVRLDIRPRLVLRDDPPRADRRRGLRLPPLAVPAVGYWLGMGALTYFFATLGPHPLDSVEPAEASEGSPTEAVPRPAPPSPAEPAPLAVTPPASTSDAPPAPSEAEPAVAPEPERAHVEAAEERAVGSGRSLGENAQPPTAARQEPAPRATLAFPEFTDSSRPRERERAADGPRIDSLFERTAERPDERLPKEALPAPEKAQPTRGLMSCEAAVARNNEQLTIGGARGPTDISREQYAGILQNGSYLAGCSLPPRTVFEICAAVRDGQAIGITVVSSPPNEGLNACVRSAVSRLKFPQNPRLDVTHTRFDAVRR